MGPSIRALLDIQLDATGLLEADDIIARVAENITRTRRGRVWHIFATIDEGAGRSEKHAFHIALERIAKLEEEDLQLLAEHGRDFDSVKERLIVSAGVNRLGDYELSERLARMFVAMFGGVAGRAIK